MLAAGSAEVEFVLLGTGPRNAQPPREVREGLRHAGIGLEFMDTPTASRIYNLLTVRGPPAGRRPHRGLTAARGSLPA